MGGKAFGYPLEIFANNDCILLNLPHDFGADDILELVDEDDIPRLLRIEAGKHRILRRSFP